MQNACCFPVTSTPLFLLKQNIQKINSKDNESIDFGALNVHFKFSGNLTVRKL